MIKSTFVAFWELFLFTTGSVFFRAKLFFFNGGRKVSVIVVYGFFFDCEEGFGNFSRQLI